MRIGILADTHDKILPDLFSALAGVDEILHAGDICKVGALAEIETIAPVLAVHGNCDGRKLAERLPAERRVERGGVRILLLHGHQTGNASVDRIAKLVAARPADLVVFGHSHEACDVERGGIRYFNPGTAGGVRYPPTVGILTIANESFTLEHAPLRR